MSDTGSDPLSPSALAQVPKVLKCGVALDDAYRGFLFPERSVTLGEWSAAKDKYVAAVRDAVLSAERTRLLSLTPEAVVAEAEVVKLRGEVERVKADLDLHRAIRSAQAEMITRLRREIERLTAERDAMERFRAMAFLPHGTDPASIVEHYERELRASGYPENKGRALARAVVSGERLSTLQAQHDTLRGVVREWVAASAELALHKVADDDEYWRKHYRLRTAEVNLVAALAAYPVEGNP